MVRLADPEEGIEQAGKIAAEQEGDDAGLVGLEGEGGEVAHQLHVLADVFGQAVVGPFHGEERLAGFAGGVGGFVGLGTHPVDALLHFADAGEVFVELGLVVGADFADEAGGVVLHAVEDALVPAAAAILEEAVEGERRIDFHRHG
jgi:hypothetical protein